MAKTTALSSLIRVKDKNGLYYVTLPISTLKEVYYDMEERITLEDYFNSIHVVPIVHHIDNIDDIAMLPESGWDIKFSDLITVGGTKTNPLYIFFVKSVDDLSNMDSYIQIGGTKTEYGYVSYDLKYETVLQADKWVEAIGNNYPENLKPSDTTTSVHPYYDGNNNGYMYLIETEKISDFTADYNINFTDSESLELASDIEIVPYYKVLADDDKVYIILYSTRKPDVNMYIQVATTTLAIPNK